MAELAYRNKFEALKKTLAISEILIRFTNCGT